jgi:predicted nucleotidyltransferase
MRAMEAETAEAVAAAARAAGAHPDLRLLLLVGSRGRGDETPRSDWDFAYLARPALDGMALLADLAAACGSDQIDLADLARASGLFRHRAARDGIRIHEAEPGTFDRFWFEAVSFWCDAEPILAAGYESVLADLGP